MFTVNIIGSGNMAWFLANSFAKTNVEMKSIYSRNTEQGNLLAQAYQIPFVDNIEQIDKDADITFLALSDDVIEKVSNQITVKGIVAHCSGMLSIDVINKHNERAVFYPLQTIVKSDLPSASGIPICLEANSDANLRIVESLAEKISHHIHFINSTQRQYYHLAAVLANNFTNHLYALADGILKEQHLSFDLLKPLIIETARKASVHAPLLNQTGPAKRDDKQTIEKHLTLLDGKDELKELYKKITQSIFSLHQQK